MYGQFVIISSNEKGRIGGILLTYSFIGYSLQIGQLVYVCLKQGKTDKICNAILLSFCEKPEFECRSIHSIVPNQFVLKPNQLLLFSKIASYYLTPQSQCLKLFAPNFLWQIDKKRKLSKIFAEIVEHTGASKNDLASIRLTEKQEEICRFISDHFRETILLHGVTGSGKTEIYMSIVQRILHLGKTSLILVPEISLTPQMARRFKTIFGDALAILHSGISPTEFVKEWLSIYYGKVRIVLGVRSAIFCPLDNIGLIVVDEEHDQSYKSSERPSYNARDVAVLRAKLEGACCLLGSATPSLESIWNAKTNKYKYIELKSKYSESTKVKNYIFEVQKNQISAEILNLIRENHKSGFQTLVLINRRGFVNYALCASCSTALTCPNCSVTTTIHNYGKREVCHYCDFNQETRKTCPNCQGINFILKGVGTQNIESILQDFIPNMKVERLDRDNLTKRENLTKILNRFANTEIDCLVGTQILAKGHDFANVTLIVILNLEDGLLLPDFRSAEKTFHLLTQAIGRVGRGKYEGIVALQSMIKHHPVIEFALKGNINLFLEYELKNRLRAQLPPYCRLILLEIRHKEKIVAEKNAKNIKTICLDYWKEKKYHPDDFFLSGPYDAAIEKIKQIYRLHICVHMSKKYHPNQCIPASIYADPKLKSILKIDVDPQSFM